MNQKDKQNQQGAASINVFTVDEATAAGALREKLIDALTPGYQVEFDPWEAEEAGAFVEDALSEQDAIDSDMDLVDANLMLTANDWSRDHG